LLYRRITIRLEVKLVPGIVRILSNKSISKKAIQILLLKTCIMKKVIVVMVACTLSTGLFAQTSKDKKSERMEQPQGSANMHKMKDCVMMEDGKMMVMKGGKTMEMNKDMTLANGTTVMTDGSVKWKNGKTAMLKDGECIYMDGKMGGMHMSSDKMKKEDKM